MSHARVPFHRTPFRRRRPAIPFSEVFICVRGFSGSALVRIRFWQRHIVISILSDSNLQKKGPICISIGIVIGTEIRKARVLHSASLWKTIRNDRWITQEKQELCVYDKSITGNFAWKWKILFGKRKIYQAAIPGWTLIGIVFYLVEPRYFRLLANTRRPRWLTNSGKKLEAL